MIKRIGDFWFKNYSYEFFSIYRTILFLAAGYYSYDLHPPLETCKNWAPIGFLKIIQWPCGSDLLSWVSNVAIAFCILSALGFYYGITSKLAFVSLLIQWGVESSYGKVSNSLHLMVMAVGILSLAINSREGDRGSNYGWTLQLVKVYVVWVYFINGLAKTFLGDWRWALSDNLFLILSGRPYLGDLGYWLLEQPPVYSMVLAIFVLYIVELSSPLALFKSSFGILYFFIWSSFHLGTSLVLGGHFVFFSQIFVCTIFLPLEKMGTWRGNRSGVCP